MKQKFLAGLSAKGVVLKTWLMLVMLLVGVGTSWGESIEINATNSGVTGSYADKTFDVDDVTFGFTQWMKSTNIQAKKSTTNSCYNVDAIPGTIKKITVVQTGTARAIKMYGGTSTKPTTEVTAPSTAATMEFDFSGKNYTYFSMTTPSNAVYINTITIEYETAGGGSSDPIDASWTVDPASVSVKTSKKATATITTNYNGSLSVSSANSSIATATISGKVITVTGVAEGNTTLTVTGAATSAYNAISKSIDVTVTANNRPVGEVFYESFDDNDGTGGNDDQWSGAIASNAFKSDNIWVTSNASGAKECAKFGLSSKLGNATTPAIFASGKFTLKFKAAAWDNKDEKTFLNLSATNATLSVTGVDLVKGAWSDYSVDITNATSGFKITFEGYAANNSRFFLDEVSIVPAGPAEIPNLIKTSSADLYVGDEIDDLKTYLNLPNDYEGTVSFSSEQDGTLVTLVDEMLSADAAGTATINVTAAANGNYSETTGTITLTISKKTPVLSFENTSYTIFNLADNNENKFVGQEATATEDATVKYAITGTGATIDANGVVTITGAGETTITASTDETGALNAATSVSYTLNIVDPSISMTPASGTVSAENPTVTFTGNGVAIDYLCEEPELIDETTGTTISVDLTQSCTIAVTTTDDAGNKFTEEYDVKYLQDAGLQFSAFELRVLVGSEDFVEPVLTKATDAEVTYSLVYEKEENIDKVATIDPVTGKLTLKKLSTETQGGVTVKATTPATDEYTAGEATYELVVYRNVPTFTWSADAVTIDQDELDQLPTPIVQDDRNVTSLTSSNTEVATIVDGAITFVGYGTTTITGKTTATWDYASAQASYELTFAPRYTVTFSINGDETELREETTGAGVTAPNVEDNGEYTLAGWSKTEVSEETTTAPELVTLTTGKYMPTENTTLYAVYKRVVEGEGGSSDEGEFLIYANVSGTKYYMTGKPVAASTTINQILSSTDKNQATTFTIKKNPDNANQYSIAYEEGGTTYYLVCTKNGSNYFLQSSTDSYHFTRSAGTNGSYRLTSTYSGQIIAYRASTYKVFKMFKDTNVTAGSNEYFDLELEQVSGGSTTYYTTIIPETFSLTVTSAGYATLCLPFNAKSPNSATVYTAEYQGNGKVELSEVETGMICANEGYIVANEGTHIFRATSEDVTAPTPNHLVGVTSQTELNGENNDIFIFANKNNKVGFYILSGTGKLGANKAYLQLPAGGDGRSFIGFGEDDETAISTIDAMPQTDGKYLMNNKIVIIKNGVMYNVNGQRMR